MSRSNILLTSALVGLTLINGGMFIANYNMSNTIRESKEIDVTSEELNDQLPEKVSSDINKIVAENNLENPKDIEDAVRKALPKAEIEKIALEAVLNHPKEVLASINTHLEKKQQEDALAADKLVINNKDKIVDATGYPVLGNRDGQYEIVYFFDSNCGYCKKIDSDLRAFVSSRKDVKLVHKEMPFLTDTSRLSATVGGMIWKENPEAYEKYHAKLLSNQKASTETDIAAALFDAVGSDKANKILADAQNPESAVFKEVDARINKTLELTSAAQIRGTPFIFIKDSNYFVRGASPTLIQELNSALEGLADKQAQ